MFKSKKLIPTTVVDKNGKQTTVHKKPGHAAPAVTMPAPEFPQDAHRTRQEVATLIQETYEQTQDKFIYPAGYIRKALYGYSDEELRELHRSLKDPSLAEGIIQQIINTEPEDFIMDTIHFHQKTNSISYQQTIAELRSMEHYDDFTMHENLRTLDENTQQQCIALMTFPRLLEGLPEDPSSPLNYLLRHEEAVTFIDDQDLVELIISRPDDAERIAEIILQYGTTDTATINGIMQGALPAIAEGHL